MLDPQDLQAVQLAAVLLRYNFLSTLIIILCYSIYLPLFLKWLLALILALFIPTTVHLATEVSSTLIFFRFASVGNADSDIIDKLSMVYDMAPTDALYYTGRINILLIDVIVVWRAYVLQPHRRWLRILLATLLICTLTFSASLMIANQYLSQHFLTKSLLYRLGIARGIIALSLTVLGAVCIGWTAWEFHKSVEESQFRLRTTPLVARTFRVLIEGCVILTVLQIATISLDFGMLYVVLDRGDHPFFWLASPVKISSMLVTEITIFASVCTFLCCRGMLSNSSTCRSLGYPSMFGYSSGLR
ncbi:hypothetical protein DL96DRAFT_243199 [Flagelloscypha sp. PMI_526]|nr:hypothetical protein DL96DRAFT_243199 [Flagelloscypha sp. PMI_526]